MPGYAFEFGIRFHMSEIIFVFTAAKNIVQEYFVIDRKYNTRYEENDCQLIRDTQM